MMKQMPAMLIVVGATLGAAAAIWFWALRPLSFHYVSSTSATDADIIRQYWPHRLIQPEWVTPAKGTGERLMKWHLTETGARVVVVLLPWLAMIGWIYGRNTRDHSSTV
jgi:hypothetical protein